MRMRRQKGEERDSSREKTWVSRRDGCGATYSTFLVGRASLRETKDAERSIFTLDLEDECNGLSYSYHFRVSWLTILCTTVANAFKE